MVWLARLALSQIGSPRLMFGRRPPPQEASRPPQVVAGSEVEVARVSMDSEHVTARQLASAWRVTFDETLRVWARQVAVEAACEIARSQREFEALVDEVEALLLSRDEAA